MPLSTGFSVPAPQVPMPPPPPSTPVPLPTPTVVESVDKPSSGFSAKELALYVGVPVVTLCVAGGLYYYYTKSSGRRDEEGGKESGQDESQEAPVAVVAPMESGKKEEDKEMSPLEKAQAAKNRGNKYFKAGRFEQAIECYTNAIKECPEDHHSEISTFYQNRAAACEQMKNWKQVIDDTTEAIKLNPKYTKALSRRAKANEVLNEKRSALEDITAVCLLEGFSNQNNMMLADRVLKSFGKELADEYYKTRPRILPSATFIKAYLDSFNEDLFVVEVSAEDAPLTKYVEISKKMSEKDYEDIVSLCTLEINSDGPYKNLCLLLRGTLYTLMGDIENGMSDLTKIIELETTEDNTKLKIDALIKRGSLKMQQSDDKACYADFDEAMKLNPNNPNVYHHRGQLYFLTERLTESQGEFKKAISLDKNFVAPRLQLGFNICKVALQSMSPLMMSEANAVLEETITLFPDYAEAWSLYGQLLQDQQKLDSALEKLEKSISLAPQNPNTYVYKALLMLQWKQDIDAAHKLISEAIRLDDKCDLAVETLATLEVQRGNNEEAIRLFERAIDLVRTEAELANTFSLLEAAKAQMKVVKQYGITLPKLPGMM